MKPRPPVVAILGHVDHGKTTLLDYIRKTNITAKEHGGITQRIGAYEIATGLKDYATDKITFIDTPGHEAFSKLRARGATVADLALLVIDAKDSLKPQTSESISHIKSAGIPFIVVLNKTDLPDANPEKVKLDLLKEDVQVEAQGGKTPVAEISAKTGKGVPELLETIHLVASDLNLQYDPAHTPVAYIIETKKDKRGVVASVILKDGTLRVGMEIWAGSLRANVRSMLSDRGESLREAAPSTPFELLGFTEMPEVGAAIINVSTEEAEEKKADEPKKALDLESLLAADAPKEKRLALIIKADAQGSLEAIHDSLLENKNVDLVLQAVGEIHKSDVFLGKSTGAIIIGFNTKPNAEVADLAKQEKVVIKTYNIIYELIEELTEVADLLKEKEEQEKNAKGEARILATFLIEGEKIVGVKVLKGKVNVGDSAEQYRDGNLLGKTKLFSLKVRAKAVEEVKKDQEAGMLFSPPLDMRSGDVIQFIL